VIIVNKDRVELVEGKPELIGEASTLGLAPGEWPFHVGVVDDEGEGFLFENPQPERVAGELVAQRYSTSDGRLTLTVLND